MSADRLTLQYIAGFVDGEGCIGFSNRSPKQNRYYVYLRVANTNQQILNDIKAYFGIGSIQVANSSHKNGNRKTVYYYQVVCRKAVKVITLLLPYLRVKQVQAKLVIDFQSRVKFYGYNNKNQKLFEWQEGYYKKMRKLNKRGIANVE